MRIHFCNTIWSTNCIKSCVIHADSTTTLKIFIFVMWFMTAAQSGISVNTVAVSHSWKTKLFPQMPFFLYLTIIQFEILPLDSEELCLNGALYPKSSEIVLEWDTWHEDVEFLVKKTNKKKIWPPFTDIWTINVNNTYRTNILLIFLYSFNLWSLFNSCTSSYHLLIKHLYLPKRKSNY